MKLHTARDAYSADPFLKVSVYGQSGVGKTDWASRSPRPLIAVTEPQGKATIANRSPDALVVELRDHKDFRELWMVMKMAPASTVDGQPCVLVGEEKRPVQTFVLDSGTDLQRMMMGSMLGLGDSFDQMDFEQATKGLSLQQWGRLMDAMVQLWRDQRALRMNTVFIHLAETSVDDENRRLVMPMLYGKKLPFQMGQFFNAQGIALVARDPVTGASKHAIRWVADSTRYQTKPAPGWPPVIENTPTPGQTTLGSLALFSAPEGLVVPHAPGDSAEWVRASAERALADPDAAQYEPDPDAAQHEPVTEPRERRRRRS